MTDVTMEPARTGTGEAMKHLRFGPHNLRIAFRHWRRARPFWGGLLSILGGAIITYFPLTAIRFVLVSGDTVWRGAAVGMLIMVFGLFLWFAPGQRQVVGVLIVTLSVASFITSDLGGFVIGMMLAMTGGSLGFAWVPVESWKPKPWHRQARREWKDERQVRRELRKVGVAVSTLGGERIADMPVVGTPVERPAAEPVHATGVAEAQSEAGIPVTGRALEESGATPSRTRRFFSRRSG